MIQARLLDITTRINKDDTIFLSAEDLSHDKIPIQTVRKTLRFLKSTGHEVKILVLIRNPKSLTTSIVQQKIKGGWSIESISKRPIPLYKERLENWYNECTKSSIPISLHCIENIEENIEEFVLNKCSPKKIHEVFSNLDKSRTTPNESLTNSQARALSNANQKLNKFLRESSTSSKEKFVTKKSQRKSHVI